MADSIGRRPFEQGNKRNKRKINATLNIRCERCGYSKTYKKEFHREEIELLIVTLKIFEWLTCEICHQLYVFTLTFAI
jgi:hypothetical protein